MDDNILTAAPIIDDDVLTIAQTKKLEREKRNLAAVGGFMAEVAGLAVALTIATVSGVALDNYMKEKYRASREEANMIKKIRRSMNCSENNYGCIESVCWSNCGPRLYSADWCVVKPPKSEVNIAPDGNDTVISIKTVHSVDFRCVTKNDCNPCWACASTCMLEGAD